MSKNTITSIDITNNFILPSPGIVYSTIIFDRKTIDAFHRHLVTNGDERTVALAFNKPSKAMPPEFRHGKRRRETPEDIFFPFRFLADIITIKPIPDGRLLCLFNLIDTFTPEKEWLNVKGELKKDSLRLHSEKIKDTFGSLDEAGKTKLAGLFQFALELALKQGLNFYENMTATDDLGSPVTYCNFLNFCIPFLDMEESTYSTYMTETDMARKLEFAIDILSSRFEMKKLESENNRLIDENIKNYSSTSLKWQRIVKGLQKTNSEIIAGGLDAIDSFLHDEEKGEDEDAPQSEEDDRDDKARISCIAFDPSKMAFGQEDERPRRIAFDEDSYYGKYAKEHNPNDAVKKYVDFVNSLEAEDCVKEEIAGEIRKIESGFNQASIDYNTSIDYLETCVKIPFNAKDDESFDVEEAKKTINESHYGMKDVKKRICEFMTLKELSKAKDGAIICLVGPPGVGKTSIASSIAKALGRQYFRFSAGGVRDEAEFIGHRRTYVAAQPGKIVQGFIRTKVMNPVFLIDEIDKMSANNIRGRGDASSTLLNILDPEQNKNFTDLYLNFPIDLSGTIFILTANDISELPAPLVDRMEVIEVPGYLTAEKVMITKNYLFSRVLEKFGIADKADTSKITDGEIEYLITHYTREAGVRGVRNELEKLIRAEVDEQYGPKKRKYAISLDRESLKKHLGTEKFDPEDHVSADRPGTSVGLAWTATGGCALKVEITRTAGKGELKLTGQLGDVMKESAGIAFTYMQSIADDDGFFANHDFHLHIPEGATPKDGPSAGITILCAFYSLYNGRTMRENMAMTGELTLSGEVMPIGGLREKLSAAKANGVTTVLIPDRNIKDLDDIDGEIKNGLEIVPVKSAEEVLGLAFAAKEAR